jgi:hypothetical protein
MDSFFGWADHLPVDYFPLDENHRTRSQDAYAMSKWIGEEMAEGKITSNSLLQPCMIYTSNSLLQPCMICDLTHCFVISAFARRRPGNVQIASFRFHLLVGPTEFSMPGPVFPGSWSTNGIPLLLLLSLLSSSSLSLLSSLLLSLFENVRHFSRKHAVISPVFFAISIENGRTIYRVVVVT